MTTYRVVGAIVISLLAASWAGAESSRTIKVKVVEPNGRSVAGAICHLSQRRAEESEVRKMQAVSGADGQLKFKDIPLGTYVLDCGEDGFLPASIGPFEIREKRERPFLPDPLVIALNPLIWNIT